MDLLNIFQHFWQKIVIHNIILRSDINCAAYGGKASSKDVITRIPIVFIHGVSDIEYGQGSQDGHEVWQTGFRALVQYLTDQGF